MRNSSWWVIVAMLGCASLLLAEEKKAATVDGTWKWTYKTRDGKDVEAAIKLKQDGEKLTGSYVARDGKETPISDGKIKGDELSFDVNRDVGDQKMLFKYTGKTSGDTITGKIVFGREKPLPHDWEAKRAKE
jgi:major membrane immunogen (membrane-anchored lipoprotein)